LFFSLDTTHGPREANIANRHVGDLGNITTDAYGNVTLNIADSIIQLYNATQSIIDRTAIVHLHRDDGGQGGFPDSHTTGYDYIVFFL
jgi:Cu-Zn family superoxide dismutase